MEHVGIPTTTSCVTRYQDGVRNALLLLSMDKRCSDYSILEKGGIFLLSFYPLMKQKCYFSLSERVQKGPKMAYFGQLASLFGGVNPLEPTFIPPRSRNVSLSGEVSRSAEDAS